MKPIQLLHRLFLLICLSLGQGNLALAKDQLEQFKTGKTKYGELIVEVVHPLEIVEYTPIVKMSVIKGREKSDLSGPERSLITYLSAINENDYDWFMSTWTKQSQQLMKDVDKKNNRSSLDWVDMWKSQFPIAEIELLHRIRYGKFVLIHFKMKFGKAGATFEDTVALVEEDRQWFLTQALSQSPVLSRWNIAGGRVRMPSSTWIDTVTSKDVEMPKFRKW